MPKSSKLPAIQPLHDRVLVNAPPRAKPNAEKIIGGVIIPPIASRATQADLESPHFVTEVLAVGHKCEVVKTGQKIVVRKPDCFVVKLTDDGPEHVMVREQHIVAVLK